MKLKKLNLQNIENEPVEYWNGLKDNLKYNLESIEIDLDSDTGWTLTVNGFRNPRLHLDDFEYEEIEMENREIDLVKSMLLQSNKVTFYLDSFETVLAMDFYKSFVFGGKNHKQYDNWVDRVLDALETVLVGSEDELDYTLMDFSMLLYRVLEGQEKPCMMYSIDDGVASVYDSFKRVDCFVPGEFIKKLHLLDLKAVVADITARNTNYVKHGYDYRCTYDNELEKNLDFIDFELAVNLSVNTIEFRLDNLNYVTLELPRGIKCKKIEYHVLDNQQLKSDYIFCDLNCYVDNIISALSGEYQVICNFRIHIMRQIIEILNYRLMKKYYKWDNGKLIIRA